MTKQESIATCLAKLYESKLESSKGPGNSGIKSPGGPNSMDKKLNLINDKVDKLLHFQEDVLGKLENVYHGMDNLERGMDKLSAFHHPSHPLGPQTEVDVREEYQKTRTDVDSSDLIQLLKRIHEDSMIHREKLDSLEKMVSTIDKVVEFVGNTIRNSKILEFILKGAVPWRKETLAEAKDSSEDRDAKTKHGHVNKVMQTGDPKKPTVVKDKGRCQKSEQCGKVQTKEESTECVSQSETSKPGSGIEELNVRQENTAGKGADTAPSPKPGPPVPYHPIDRGSKTEEPAETQSLDSSYNPSIVTSSGPEPARSDLTLSENAHEENTTEKTDPNQDGNVEDHARSGEGRSEDNSNFKTDLKKTDVLITVEKLHPQASKTSKEQFPSTKTTKDAKSPAQQKTCDTGWKEKEESKKGNKEIKSLTRGKLRKAESMNKEVDTSQAEGPTLQSASTPQLAEASSLHVVDDSPPPPAPFNHRIVSIKQAVLSSCYTVCQHEVLGGGRFGQVHKCVEITSGLRLAAKIVKAKGSKDRDEVKNEINVMNQLNHVNLIQLYDAFECKNDLTLIMEYLDGGELFDRITDENYNLTELDAIMFTKQICEAVYYLHQQYILHLDLKPENILCVSRTGNQIKIIDFGLARRYKPREKLRVNFGTPEFLAPEVVNYDFVSFPTDMWSVGVITYMLLSGLSPFLGESDAETMNYIVNCNWDFDAETFEQVSEEAKDFISRLLIKEKSCRLSAGQCLKHEWLASLPTKAKKYKVRLKSQLLLQRYMAQKKWKKHFYVVAAANRLKKFQLLSLKPS
uniref:Myosin light chain kinase 3 n=1 Tax=Leptobrachium leishanense TaxID=445787 RepID=A0A8C5WK91_9ANUR